MSPSVEGDDFVRAIGFIRAIKAETTKEVVARKEIEAEIDRLWEIVKLKEQKRKTDE